MERDVFECISPLDNRYYASDPELNQRIAKYLSENAYIHYELRVEAALTKALAARSICSEAVAKAVQKACTEVTPEEVYLEEEKTRHNIRALVNCIQRRVPEDARPFVHFTTTSVDIMDTATALRYRDFCAELLLPLGFELLSVLVDLARRERATVQMGRTHGQHAVPITFGFAMSEYIVRLGNRLLELEARSKNLRGKIAGAVGAYNASSIFFEDADQFEREVLILLGLAPSEYSTQIVMPEYLTDLVHSAVSLLGVLANLADDIRHLQRTEIAEVAETFERTQVGSSTMPHKRNPWNFEHVKSLWKTFMPRMITVYMDQISEHQRDLTNSASGRFAVEVFAGTALAIARMTKVMSKLVVDAEHMQRNFESTKDYVIAEPLYILLAAYGHPDAHETVRVLTLEAEEKGTTVKELLRTKPEYKEFLSKLTERQLAFVERPETYIGRSIEKTDEVTAYWGKVIADRALYSA